MAIDFASIPIKYTRFIEIRTIVNSVLAHHFSLENKTYKEAWAAIPNSKINKIREIPEFQTEEAKKKFKEITGLDL